MKGPDPAESGTERADSLYRRSLLLFATVGVAAGSLVRSAGASAPTPAGALPSWNDGPAKQAILDFVRDTTDPAGKDFVPPAERIATFDQDGTLWVEQPIYTQVVYCLDGCRRW